MIKELTPKSPALLQLDAFNKSGGAGEKNTFAIPADTAWAVVGTLVSDGATVEDVPTLETAIRALSEVGAVEPLHWAQAPDEILINKEAEDALLEINPEATPEELSAVETYEVVMVVVADVAQTIGFGDGKGQAQTTRLRPYEMPKPPLGKKFIVWGLKVPTSLDQAGIVALETAITGAHSGITSAHHLLDGVIDAECVGDASIEIEAHT